MQEHDGSFIVSVPQKYDAPLRYGPFETEEDARKYMAHYVLEFGGPHFEFDIEKIYTPR